MSTLRKSSNKVIENGHHQSNVITRFGEGEWTPKFQNIFQQIPSTSASTINPSNDSWDDLAYRKYHQLVSCEEQSDS